MLLAPTREVLTTATMLNAQYQTQAGKSIEAAIAAAANVFPCMAAAMKFVRKNITNALQRELIVLAILERFVNVAKASGEPNTERSTAAAMKDCRIVIQKAAHASKKQYQDTGANFESNSLDLNQKSRIGGLVVSATSPPATSSQETSMMLSFR